MSHTPDVIDQCAEHSEAAKPHCGQAQHEVMELRKMISDRSCCPSALPDSGNLSFGSMHDSNNLTSILGDNFASHCFKGQLQIVDAACPPQHCDQQINAAPIANGPTDYVGNTVPVTDSTARKPPSIADANSAHSTSTSDTNLADQTLPTDLPSQFPGSLQPTHDTVRLGKIESINDVPESLRQYATVDGNQLVIDGKGQQLPPLDLENAQNVTIKNARFSNADGSAFIARSSDNISLQNCEFGNSANEGVRFENSSNISLQDNYIHDTGDHGVEVYQCQSVNVSHNFLQDNGGAGVQFDGVSGPGNRINYNISRQTNLNKPFEDHVSWLATSGTPDDRGQIIGNYIEGRSSSESGSGITIEPGQHGRTGGGYVDVSNNTLINPGRNGLAATGGDYISFTNNTIDQSKTDGLEGYGVITYKFVSDNPPGSNITISNNTSTGGNGNWMDPSVPKPEGWDSNTVN